jgi:2-amino-4-hydroxy-6-hydroxymethyldihydropteridine diphosphokinase
VVDAETLRAWLSLGSNIDRRQHIARALRDLEQQFGELVISPIYESAAVGCEGGNFYNLVVGIRTNLPIDSLARRLRAIEQSHGRRRSANKFAARTLDIDPLTYGEQVVTGPDIQLPRDEITRYAFVLLPLSDVAGNEVHPLSGLTYRELWQAFDDSTQSLWRVDSDRTG